MLKKNELFPSGLLSIHICYTVTLYYEYKFVSFVFILYVFPTLVNRCQKFEP